MTGPISPYGPCVDSWGVPTFTQVLSPAAMAVTGVAAQVAADVLWSMTARTVGSCELTVRPCQSSCFGSWPFLARWWDMGTWPRPVFYEGVWYNITCSNGCAQRSCSCRWISQVTLPAPVQGVTQVKVDGAVLDPSQYRVDDGRYLVRLGDGNHWPLCNDLALADTEVGTWSVTVTFGIPLSPLGMAAWGELTTQMAKLLANDEDCQISKPVQQVIRQGVTMNFLDPADLFPEGRLGMYLCDLFIHSMNPNRLNAPSAVYDIDSDAYRIAGDPA